MATKEGHARFFQGLLKTLVVYCALVLLFWWIVADDWKESAYSYDAITANTVV